MVVVLSHEQVSAVLVMVVVVSGVRLRSEFDDCPVFGSPSCGGLFAFLPGFWITGAVFAVVS
jgi:hypothetical protein